VAETQPRCPIDDCTNGRKLEKTEDASKYLDYDLCCCPVLGDENLVACWKDRSPNVTCEEERADERCS
jgi:hypothetical protein